MNDHDDENDPYQTDDSPWGESSVPLDAAPVGADIGGNDGAIDDDPMAGLAQAAAVAGPRHAWQSRGPVLDDAGRIDADIHCKSCGYNLRGQFLNNTCPECGTSVEWSARGDRLAYYDPRWLGSLSRGALWLIISIITGIVLGIVNGIVVLAITMNQAQPFAPQPGSQSGPFMQPQQPGALQNSVTFVIALISAGLFLYAIWLLTAPEPSRQNESPLSSRNLVRWGSVGYVALIIVSNAINFASAMAGGVVGVVAMVSYLVSFFAMFVYLRGLALRAPDTSLAGQTRLVMWGLVGSVGLYLVTVLLMVIFAASMFSMSGPRGGGGGGGLIIGFVAVGGGCLSLIGLVVFGIWAFVLLFLYRACFRRAEQQALASR